MSFVFSLQNPPIMEAITEGNIEKARELIVKAKGPIDVSTAICFAVDSESNLTEGQMKAILEVLKNAKTSDEGKLSISNTITELLENDSTKEIGKICATIFNLQIEEGKSQD
ncbi:MAG: hypothetical protein COT85_03695 [Chlamydiae bacterium CG10_big_fil_rev_8_21_14_0_10_42_34]|nr:MAG: hypothetical protein COT85_03695 [Chlamydiae bacterium CG10_big_fil_rev_8_21_14_0_10_42_34]